jgi:hypothetical protein
MTSPIEIYDSLRQFDITINQIENLFSSWLKNEDIKAQLAGLDPEATTEACMTMIISAEAVAGIIDELRKEIGVTGGKDVDAKPFRGMKYEEYLRLLGDSDNADCSPAEYHLGIVLTSLKAAGKHVREFITDHGSDHEDLGTVFIVDVDLRTDDLNDAFLEFRALLADQANPGERKFFELIRQVYRRIGDLKFMIVELARKDSE